MNILKFHKLCLSMLSKLDDYERDVNPFIVKKYTDYIFIVILSQSKISVSIEDIFSINEKYIFKIV